MDINATLIAQMVTFIILVVITMKFIWPPLNKAMEARRKKIEEGLSAADKGQETLALAQTKVEDLKKVAREESRHIVAMAHERAELMIENARTEARVEAERIIENAKAEVANEMNRAREQLKNEIVSISSLASMKIIGSEINADKFKELVGTITKEQWN